MEERQRVKIVDYVGTQQGRPVEDRREAERRSSSRSALDSFIDPGLLRQVAGVVREVYAEKGYQYAEVKPEIKEVEGGPKLVNVTFHITEGPKVRIREVDFVGQQGDHRQRAAPQDEGEQGRRALLVRSSRAAPTRKSKFEDDAEKVHATITASAATSGRRSGSRS